MTNKIKNIWFTDDSFQTNTHHAPQQPRFVLLGAADDRAVANVQGRLGSNHGPDTIRRCLGNLFLGLEGQLQSLVLGSGHNSELGQSIEEGHQTFRNTISSYAKRGTLPIAIGGSHDYGYPHVAGITEGLNISPSELAVINIDAHLDVRPRSNGKITSGSPFYLAIEEGVLLASNFYEFGIQEHANDIQFFEYLTSRGAHILTLHHLRTQNESIANQFRNLVRQLVDANKKILVSFDLDAVQACDAPGVSAPQSEGLTSHEFLEMCRIAGDTPAVVSVGYFEVNPNFDIDDRTARLTATGIHRFLTHRLKNVLGTLAFFVMTTMLLSASTVEASGRLQQNTINQQLEELYFKAKTIEGATERKQLHEEAIKIADDLRNNNTIVDQKLLGLKWWVAHRGELAKSEGVLSALKTAKELEKALLELKSINPNYDNALADRTLGFLYSILPPIISIGSTRKADQHLRAALKLEPEFPPNKLYLAEFLVKQGELTEARKLANEVKRQLPFQCKNPVEKDEWLQKLNYILSRTAI